VQSHIKRIDLLRKDYCKLGLLSERLHRLPQPARKKSSDF